MQWSVSVILTGRIVAGMKKVLTYCTIVDESMLQWANPSPERTRRSSMGDKGKKDKAKGQKQKAAKDDKATKDRSDKAPKRKE